MSNASSFIKDVNKGLEAQGSYQNAIKIAYPEALYTATPSFTTIKIKNKQATLSSGVCLATGEGCKLSNGKITNLGVSDEPSYIVLGKNQELYSYIPTSATKSNIFYDIFKDGENVNVLPIGAGCDDDSIAFYMPATGTILEGDKLKYGSDKLTLAKATTSNDVAYYKAVSNSINGVVYVKRYYEVIA